MAEPAGGIGNSMVETRPTVVVVDDDEDIRKSLRRLLGSAGFDVKTFASAEGFRESMPEQVCACLILDVRMPGESGIDLHQQLIQDEHAIATVFISAHEDELLRARRETSQVVNYLRKPFDPDELLSAVQKAVADSGNDQSPNDNFSGSAK